MQTLRLIGYGPDVHLTRPDLTSSQHAALWHSWRHWSHARTVATAAVATFTFAAFILLVGLSMTTLGAQPVIAWALAGSLALVGAHLAADEVRHSWRWHPSPDLALPLTAADRLRVARLAPRSDPDRLHQVLWDMCLARAQVAGVNNALRTPDARDREVAGLLRDDLSTAVSEATALSEQVVRAARHMPPPSYTHLA